MHLRNGLSVGAGNDFVFQRFQPFAELLQQGEVVVDEGVEHGVGQVIGPGVSKLVSSFADALAHRIETVSLALLERKDEIPAEKQAQLFRFQPLARVRHPDDDEIVRRILLPFCPLVDINDVFERQTVKAKNPAYLFDGCCVPQAVHVDPRDRAFL